MEGLVRSQVVVSVHVALLRVLVLPQPLHAEDVQLRHGDLADRLVSVLTDLAVLLQFIRNVR